MIRTIVPAAFFGSVLLLAATRAPDAAAQRALPRLSAASFTTQRVAHDTVPLFTEEQVVAGDSLFQKVCAECHELADYAGPEFKEKWTGKSMLELYQEIAVKMPDDNPGSLTPEQYGNALAFVLKQNGMRAGLTKIAPDTVAMAAITLKLTPSDSTAADSVVTDTTAVAHMALSTVGRISHPRIMSGR